MKKTTDNTIKLESPKYDYWPANNCCCWYREGAIDKACAKAGDIYVYYRHEQFRDTVYRVYKAEGVDEIEDSESIEMYEPIAEYSNLVEAKKSEYKAAFIALRAFVKESIDKRMYDD